MAGDNDIILIEVAFRRFGGAVLIASLGANGFWGETTPGSGLGLSIVRDVAELYEGKLELAHSQLGGLAARLKLPVW